MVPPSQVLRQYPDPPWRRCTFLGNHGGFSGASLWRLETSSGDFCLKAWPRDDTTPDRLAALHDLLSQGRQRGLAFLPVVLSTISGRSFVLHDGRPWVVTAWLPGVADFHARPSRPRLAAACAALAQFHDVCQAINAKTMPCPGVSRRLRALEDWDDLLKSGWRPALTTQPLMEPSVRRLVHLLPRLVETAWRDLRPWSRVPVLCHPCWCDPWHDHILFSDDHVTGLLDYGSIKVDHAAVDLARMLGSLVVDDAASWEFGMAAYAATRPWSEQDRALTTLLDRTGLIVAATKWLRWLYHERRTYDNLDAVAARLGGLADRLEYLHAPSPLDRQGSFRHDERDFAGHQPGQ